MSLIFPNYAAPHRKSKLPEHGQKIRSDCAIEEEICEALVRESAVIYSPEHIRVDVKYGQVWLTGYVAEEWQLLRAEKIAAQVRGVVGVRNDILLDCQVRMEVLQALAEDDRTSIYLVSVHCHTGWVNLNGVVPTDEAARAIEEVAASVPIVRGVLSLPWVLGLSWNGSADSGADRRTFQPMIGAAVYDGSRTPQAGRAGWVSQVILDPRNRLVSHVVVRIRDRKLNPEAKSAKGEWISNEIILPVNSIEAANSEQVWIQEGQEIQNYPAFKSVDYPPAPMDWLPPFPYRPGTVRLSC